MTKSIKKYDFRNDISIGFEIVNLKDLYRNHREKLTSSHRAGFYHIIWFQKGSPTHWVDFEEIKIIPNTILFLNKDVVHQFDKNENFVGVAILFTDAFFCKTETDIKYLRSSILFNDLFTIAQIRLQKQTTSYKELFDLLESELKNSKDNYQPSILKNLLHNILLLSERKRTEQGFTELSKSIDLDYVILFKELLDKNFVNQKQVTFYCKQIKCTAKRLNQATSKILGKTPKEVIDYRVLLTSKRLLSNTNKSVKEIGFSLGFEEPTNFVKYFRKHNHITPIEFRKKFIMD